MEDGLSSFVLFLFSSYFLDMYPQPVVNDIEIALIDLRLEGHEPT